MNSQQKLHKKKRLDLYSNTSQRIQQLEAAITKTNEQRSNYGTIADQRRLLRQFMTRYTKPDDKRKMERSGFRQAMCAFSCFGLDADHLFDHYTTKSSKEELEVERFLDMLYKQNNETSSIMILGKEKHYISKVKSDAKLCGLLQAINAKLESLTNFGELSQRERALHKILTSFTKTNRDPNLISEIQFKGALSKLNCWDKDAQYLFRAYFSQYQIIKSTDDVNENNWNHANDEVELFDYNIFVRDVLEVN